jgi:hypothetical protein
MNNAIKCPVPVGTVECGREEILARKQGLDDDLEVTTKSYIMNVSYIGFTFSAQGANGFLAIAQITFHPQLKREPRPNARCGELYGQTKATWSSIQGN